LIGSEIEKGKNLARFSIFCEKAENPPKSFQSQPFGSISDWPNVAPPQAEDGE